MLLPFGLQRWSRGFGEAGEVLRPLTHRIIVLHEPEAVHSCCYRHEPKTGDHCCYRGFCVGRFDIVASAGSAALRRCGSWAWATEEENASHRMNPAHFVAFYVVLPLFVGLLVLQLVLWLLG